MKKILLLMTALFVLGGVNSYAEVIVHCSAIGTKVKNDRCDYNSENHTFSWTYGSNCTADMLTFPAGTLSKFTTLHVETSDLSSGDGGDAQFRIVFMKNGVTQNTYYVGNAGTLNIDLAAFLTSDQLAQVDQIRIAGNSEPTSGVHSVIVDPANVYLVSDLDAIELDQMSIATAADWSIFSEYVSLGFTFVNTNLTADISVTEMVGTSDHPYTGTFNGNMHKLTVTYDSSVPCAAPFSYVNNATIQNLVVGGTIISSSTFAAGVVGQANGTTVINNCQSSVAITSTYPFGEPNDDSNTSGVLAINIANSTITVTNCLFDGSITASGGRGYCGLIGYLRGGGTLTVKNNLVLATLSGAANVEQSHIENMYRTYASVTSSDNYYKNQFGTSGNETHATDAMLYSGQVAYNLQGDQVTQYWGQGKLNTSILDLYPSLTSDPSKRVYKPTPADKYLYANVNGALPDPVKVGRLAWKFAAGPDAPYQVALTAEAAGAGFDLYDTSDAYILTVGSAGATTLVLPFSTTSLPKDVEAYTLNYTAGADEVVATRVNYITANQPVLINAPAGTYKFESGLNWDATIDYSALTSTTSGALTGVYNTELPFCYVPKDSYVLQNQGGEIGFYKVAEDNRIKLTSFRAYMTANLSNAANLRIVYVDKDATSIDKVKIAGQDDDAYYTLTGVRVKNPTTGIYIKKGQKVFVR